MKNYITEEEIVNRMGEVQKEIWRICEGVKIELRAEIKKLDMDMLDRFDKLIARWEEFEEKIDKKHSARFDSVESRLNSLENNVKLILKIVSKNDRKRRKTKG